MEGSNDKTLHGEGMDIFLKYTKNCRLLIFTASYELQVIK